MGSEYSAFKTGNSRFENEFQKASDFIHSVAHSSISISHFEPLNPGEHLQTGLPKMSYFRPKFLGSKIVNSF